MNNKQLKLPHYYIFVSEDDNSITLITPQPLEQTKKDFPVGKYYNKFQYDNYVELYNIANNFYVKVYHYNKDNLCYGLFLHKYPMHVVYNVLKEAEKNNQICCDRILNKENEMINIKDFKDIFDLADCEYIEHDKIPHEELKGGNLFTSIAEMFRTGFNRVKSLITNPIRLNAPPYYRSFLESYGNIKIKEILICKTPIQSTFNTILNAVSFGKWNETKDKLNYDQMYHLFMICKLEGGLIARVEKNQVLNIALFDVSSYKTEKCIHLANYAGIVPVNLNQMHQRALNAVGKERLYLYNASSTNCQLLINDLLENSGLMNETIKKFVMQSADKLINSLPPLVQNFIIGVTNTASMFDHILYGAGLMQLNKPMIKNRYGGSIMSI